MWRSHARGLDFSGNARIYCTAQTACVASELHTPHRQRLGRVGLDPPFAGSGMVAVIVAGQDPPYCCFGCAEAALSET